jgi:hypothetical protein
VLGFRAKDNNNNNNNTSNNWSYWGCNKKLKEKFGSCIRKTFDRLTTADGYTWNSAYHTETTAV